MQPVVYVSQDNYCLSLWQAISDFDTLQTEFAMLLFVLLMIGQKDVGELQWPRGQ